MKRPFQDSAKALEIFEGPGLKDVLEELCNRKQTCLLATPYLSFESRFLEWDERGLRLRASMNQEAARHTLGARPFKVRFPWGLTFYGGATHLLGYERVEQGRFLRLAIPRALEPDDQRKAYRLDRVGRSPGAISSSEGKILRVSLENISTLGVCVFVMETLPNEGFQTGRLVSVSLALEGGPQFQATGRIIQGQGQYLGLKFEGLPEASFQNLEQWMAPRVEEVGRQWENRAELRARAAQEAKPKPPPSGILVLSKDPALEAQAALVLEGFHEVRSCPPALAAFKGALETPPLLLVVDTAGADLEDRHRLKGLFEALAPGCPVLLLGRGGDPVIWRSLASEMKAHLYIEWNPSQAVFFRRIVQGLIRRYGKGEEG